MPRTLPSLLVLLALALAGVEVVRAATYKVSDLNSLADEEYLPAIQVVTGNARSQSEVMPSLAWLAALEEIERPRPEYLPVRGSSTAEARRRAPHRSIGAFPLVP